MKKSSDGIDQVVATVLDRIVEVTGYDPSCLLPESKLGLDLEIDPTQIKAIYEKSAHDLNVGVRIGDLERDMRSFTIRDLVDGFKARSGHDSEPKKCA